MKTNPVFSALIAALMSGSLMVHAHAQTLVTIDATSGSAVDSTVFNTDGGLTIDLGFFADYLIVGGGGGPGGGISGRNYDGGGGGGAVLGGSQSLSAISYDVTVGAGGGSAANGGASAAFGVTAAGGSRGGAAGAAVGGASGSGFSGGARSNLEAGGGGGAGGVGSAGSSSPRRGGDGGIGVTSSITGVATAYGGGGGGGGGGNGPGNGRDGGGGKNGAPRANSGGGGGAGGVGSTATAGAAGTVIVRYAGPSVGAIGGTVSSGTGSATGMTLHTFTTAGSANFNLSGVDFNARLGAVLTSGISGTGNLLYNGPGQLTLAADSSYVGDTIISAGTLRVGNGGSGGSLGSGSVINNSLLVFDRSDALTVANAISGTGTLIQQGAGTTTLASANTFAGSTRAAAGTLALAHVDALSASTLDLAAVDAGEIGFALAGANTYALGGLQGSRHLTTGGNSLSIGGNNASTVYSGVLLGDGALTKSGSGMLTLTGNNTYSGTTTIAGGTLRINGDHSGATGAVAVAAGGTLGGTGTVGGATTIQSGGTLSPGNSPGMLTLNGDLTWTVGGNYNWQLYDAAGSAGSGWDFVTVGGVLDIQSSSANPFNINLWTLSATGPDVNGASLNFDRTTDHSWRIASAAGGIQNFAAESFAINTLATNGTGGFANDTTGGAFRLAVNGNDLKLEFTPGGQQLLNASADGIATAQRYTTDNGGLTVNLALPVDLLLVGGGGGAGANATGETYLGGGGGGQVQTASGLQVTESTEIVTIGSGGSSGGGGIGSTGGSTSAFGITAVGGGGGGSNGVRSGGSSGSGFTGGVGAPNSIDAGGGAGDLENGFAGTSSPRGGGNGGAGFVTEITDTEQMYGFGGAGTSSSSGVNGDGTSTAPRANSGGGGRGGNGAAGIVVVRYAGAQAATGGTVTTDGSDTIHTFTGNGSFTLGNSIRATLAGVIEGSGNFTFSGPGTLVLTAANTYTGATVISAGTLQMGDGESSGTLGGTGSVANDGMLAFNRSDAILFDRRISGSGALTQAGSGTLTLTGANTYSGGTTVSAGRLVGNATSLQGAIANSGMVEFNQSGSGTYSGVMSGTGGLVQSGTGRLTLSGTNTYTGGTAVNAGELNVNGSIAGSAVTVSSGASLSGSGTVGAISGAGEINPGNSPGILTAPSVDASGGLSFNFEFTSLNPVYSDASASLNDVLRLTAATPFTASLTSANTVNIFFDVDVFEEGQFYTGGFFTDTQADFLSQIVDASFNYYVQDAGGSVSYGGQSYSALGAGLAIDLTTINQSAGFTGGAIDGQVVQFEVVPEPSTYALLVLAAAALGARAWRKRRRAQGL
jgi:autotransporter-associated beta strand protein